jgi:hypothetical protein
MDSDTVHGRSRWVVLSIGLPERPRLDGCLRISRSQRYQIGTSRVYADVEDYAVCARLIDMS